MAVSDISDEDPPTDNAELSTDEEAHNGVQDDETDELEERKQELEMICSVLGINYRAKLAEFGAKIDYERLNEALDFLRITRNENFQELKAISEELIKEWKASDAPLKTMYAISWIICINDSVTADEVRGQNFLSLGFVNKARKELLKLQKERKKKHSAQQKILIEMLEELHLPKSHVQFEERKPVSMDEYVSETTKVMDIIRRVKYDFADRKELVLRIQMVRQAIENGWDQKDIEDLIKKAEDYVDKVGDDAEIVPYDEGCVASTLRELGQEAVAAAQKKSKLTAGLRSGTVYKK